MGAYGIRVSRQGRNPKPKSLSITLDDLVEYWELIESDFQREYHIDLTCVDLSWRRFMTLLGGMSQDSVFFNVLRESRKNAPLENTDSILGDMIAKLGKK